LPVALLPGAKKQGFASPYAKARATGEAQTPG